jgi:hypothetical protein
MLFIADLLENDIDPEVRHQLSRLIVENPPFERGKPHRLNREDLRERIWSSMNSKMSHDTRLRCDLVDVYYALYGVKEPQIVKNPELAALYKPKKVETDYKDDNLKIEMVDAKEEPIIEELGIVTESMEEHNTDAMIIETHDEEVELKIESDYDKVIETIVPSTSDSFQAHFSDSIEAPPIAKKIKLDYASDSQSQPSIDLNEAPVMNLSENPGESSVKEHKVSSHFDVCCVTFI